MPSQSPIFARNQTCGSHFRELIIRRDFAKLNKEYVQEQYQGCERWHLLQILSQRRHVYQQNTNATACSERAGRCAELPPIYGWRILDTLFDSCIHSELKRKRHIRLIEALSPCPFNSYASRSTHSICNDRRWVTGGEGGALLNLIMNFTYARSRSTVGG